MMDKSKITANLEERLKPIPKKERIPIRRGKAYERWYNHLKSSKVFLEEEKNRLDAYAISFYSALLDLLSTFENRQIMQETKDYFLKKKNEKIVKGNYDFNLGCSWWLSKMAKIVDGMLGVSPEIPDIIHNPKGNIFAYAGNYLPIPKQIEINGILRYSLPDIVSHEYVHHIQYSLRNHRKWTRDYILKEGMAYSLGRAASFEYASNTGNMACYAESSTWASFYLSTAIGLLDEDEQKRKTCRERDVEFYPGIAAFLVAEARHGKRIYREIISSPQPAEYLIKKLK